MRYVYPAIFTPEEDQYTVDFPDLENCFTCGTDLANAIDMARDALAVVLCHAEDQKEDIPLPSALRSLAAPENGFTTLIDADTNAYRRENDNRAVKKTLTVPSWLNARAEREGINFSQTLQDALKSQLGIDG
jgi:predicted RNase H-like HicB family nuclease